MMLGWMKWLPYNVVIWLIKRYTHYTTIDLDGGSYKLWIIDEGEYLLVNEQYELWQQKEKLEAKLRKINEKLEVIDDKS